MKSFSASSHANTRIRSVALAVCLAAGALALQGCATTGAGAGGAAASEQPDYSFIVKGKTTKPQLVEKLGQPSQSTMSSSGNETLVWESSTVSWDPKTFIPYLGGALGGSNVKSYALSVALDRKGVVTDYTFNSGNKENKFRL